MRIMSPRVRVSRGFGGCNVGRVLNFRFTSGKHGSAIFLRVAQVSRFNAVQATATAPTRYVDFFNIFPSHAVLSLYHRNLHAYFIAESTYVYLCGHIYQEEEHGTPRTGIYTG